MCHLAHLKITMWDVKILKILKIVKVRNTQQEVEEPVHKRRKLSSYLRASKMQSESEDLTPESYCKAELKRYMAIPKPDPESKLLEWWKESHVSFPILSQLAMKYLSICASSSASERLFSMAGNTVYLLRKETV